MDLMLQNISKSLDVSPTDSRNLIQLLKFYRKVIQDLESDIKEYSKKFKDCYDLINHQFELENEVSLQSEEISNLRKSMSEIQAILFQERENVLRLRYENDLLKVRISENEDVVEALETPEIEPKSRCGCQNGGGNSKQVHLLRLKLRATEERLKSHVKFSSQQIEVLTNDRDICQEELKTDQLLCTSKVSKYTDRVNKLEKLLLKNTEEYFKVKSQLQVKNPVQKSQIKILGGKENVTDTKKYTTQSFKKPVASDNRLLQVKLDQSEKRLKLSRAKCINLEEKLQNLVEEKSSNEKSSGVQVKKLKEVLDVTTKRYLELQKRRNLETEGFKSDINGLKSSLKAIEKQLFQLMTESTRQDPQHEVLRQLKKNYERYEIAGNKLMNLKSKLHNLESDFRN